MKIVSFPVLSALHSGPEENLHRSLLTSTDSSSLFFALLVFSCFNFLHMDMRIFMCDLAWPLCFKTATFHSISTVSEEILFQNIFLYKITKRKSQSFSLSISGTGVLFPFFCAKSRLENCCYKTTRKF